MDDLQAQACCELVDWLTIPSASQGGGPRFKCDYFGGPSLKRLGTTVLTHKTQQTHCQAI